MAGDVDSELPFYVRTVVCRSGDIQGHLESAVLGQ